MKRSKHVVLLITSSVVLAACRRTAPIDPNNPNATPAPHSSGASYSRSSSGGASGSSDGSSSSHSVSRGGFGSHAGGGE